MLEGLALRLRLSLARPRRPGPAARAAVDVPRPEGPLIWLQIGAEGAADTAQGAVLLLRRLRRLRPGLTLVVAAPPAVSGQWPEGVIALDPPEDCPHSAALVLSHFRPGLIVLLGNDLPAALIALATEAGLKVMLADARLSPHEPGRGLLARTVQRALLQRLVRVLVRDQESVVPLARLGAHATRIEVGGVMGEPPDPLRCSEAERASIAALTRTRPVWLAAAVPAAELPAVLTAHAHVQRHAHRMLLILAPDTPDDASELAAKLAEEGWTVARRSLEGEPDTETEIFLADDPAEYGLWYRIAPVTYMGGTLSGAAGHARSPMEAAALGSAIVHGHQTAPFAPDYARLDEARAARSVYDDRSLGEAVADLMAPDRAALLAHNAWAVTSGGAAAAETVVQAILAQLEAPAQLEKA